MRAARRPRPTTRSSAPRPRATPKPCRSSTIPASISYGEILRIYFSVATDPTQLNAQFPDQGISYRGDICYTTPEQKAVATRYMAQLAAAQIYRHRS